MTTTEILTEIISDTTIEIPERLQIAIIDNISKDRNFALDLTPTDIIQVISDFYRLDISKNTRKREYVDARRMAFFLIKNKFRIPLIKIGKLLNKDHATVLWSLKTFEDLLETDGKTQSDFADIKGRLYKLSTQKNKMKNRLIGV